MQQNVALIVSGALLQHNRRSYRLRQGYPEVTEKAL